MTSRIPADRLEFSVIICAYTDARWQDLLLAINSVQGQELPPKEIIVVIDHNRKLFERLGRATESLQGIKPLVIENSQPKGLSGARNSGLAVAGGEIIAFMDDDAVADRQWLACLSEGYRQPEVGGVGGTIVPLWPGERPGWFPAEFDWVVGCTYLGMPTVVQPVRNLIGCNMSFRRNLFEEAGGFRNGIGRVGNRPVGCEETELCIRASQKRPGLKFIYNPAAQVRHRVPSSRATLKYFRERCYAEGLSKALVTTLVGANQGLDTERSYILKTLPAGVVRGFRDGLLRFDLSGFGRGGAIAAGLFITVAGYFTGKLFKSLSSETPLELPAPGHTDLAALVVQNTGS